MSNSVLIIDISEEFICFSDSVHIQKSEVLVSSLINNTNEALKTIALEIKNMQRDFKGIVFTVPIAYLNYQIATLPENLSDKNKMMFLGLEINRSLIGKRFGINRLNVTKREENGQELCDYLICAVKPAIVSKLEALSKLCSIKIKAIIPSFYLVEIPEVNELQASVWAGEDRTEIVIWGKNETLSLGSIANTGDTIGDINRFIGNYFEHVNDLNLSTLHLFGPKMRDAGIAFGLSYKNKIFEDPVRYLANRLTLSLDLLHLNIYRLTNLPKPPLAMTTRNLIFIGSAIAFSLIVFLTGFNQANNLRRQIELNKLEQQASKAKKLNGIYQKLQKEKTELSAERDFYLEITRRRTPWQLIFTDLSNLTPKNLWFERITCSKNKMLILGKARKVEDVSSLSINLNSNSKYFDHALVLGTRDYQEETNTYNDFQISTQLKSPNANKKTETTSTKGHNKSR